MPDGPGFGALRDALRSPPRTGERHALTLLAVATFAVGALGPKAVIVTQLVLAHGTPWTTWLLLALDAVAASLAAGAAIAAFRRHWLMPLLGIGGAFLGVGTALAYVAVTYPWGPTDMVRNLLLLHAWAPVLVVVTVAPSLTVDAQVVET